MRPKPSSSSQSPDLSSAPPGLKEIACPTPRLSLLRLARCPATRPEGVRTLKAALLSLLALIRRLDLRAALNGPPWLLPDPALAATLRAIPLGSLQAPGALQTLFRLSRAALGRARIPRAVRLSWP